MTADEDLLKQISKYDFYHRIKLNERVVTLANRIKFIKT